MPPSDGTGPAPPPLPSGIEATGSAADNDQEDLSDSLEAFARRLDKLWEPRRQGGDQPPPLPPPIEPMLLLGRFFLQRLLGTGSFGVVYLADDTLLKRPVALKIPCLETILNPAVRHRFLREARAAAALDHPHVVTLYEVADVGPLCYLATAYVNGPTLGEWLNQRHRNIPPQEAAVIVAELADAMAHAHARGVLHCDLKPANILMEERLPHFPETTPGQHPPNATHKLSHSPRITDFGLALVRDDPLSSTEKSLVAGTPLYMAPEQALGLRSKLTERTDIYALGGILYELLTGQPPIFGDSVLAVRQRLLNGETVRPSRLRPGLPRDLEAVCLKCLEKDPDHRYASMEELRDDLQRFLAGQPTHARPLGPVGRAWRWCRRRLAIATLLLLLTLSLGFIVAAGYQHVLQVRALQQEIKRLRGQTGRLQPGRPLAGRDAPDAFFSCRTEPKPSPERLTGGPGSLFLTDAFPATGGQPDPF